MDGLRGLFIGMLLISTSAYAGENLDSTPGPQSQAAPQEHACLPIDDVKSKNPQIKFIPLTLGQYYFAAGSYFATPPIGLPPGDGAMIMQAGDDSNPQFEIGWTRGTKEMCDPSPIPAKAAKVILSIKDGKIGGDDL